MDEALGVQLAGSRSLVGWVDDPSPPRFAWARHHSETLLQEDLALEETAAGMSSISFYDVLLAQLDKRDFRLYA